MSEILVVGSLAYDSVETPRGKVDRMLGGSANYFSLAASLLAPVRVVGVVGDDYEPQHIDLLKKRGVDIKGLQKVHGRTFHWEGVYGEDMNEAKTKATHLNVFEHFNPRLPEEYKDSRFVFLANIDPVLQMRVLEQVSKPLFVAMDTMNFWIQTKIDALKDVLTRVDALLINEGEAKLLTRKLNAIAAAEAISRMGPKTILIKRGEYGFLLYMNSQFFIMPAFPIADVVDPTGAGDTFAGGFFGYLAGLNKTPSVETLKKASLYGCLLASFTVQDFGTRGIESVTKTMLSERHEQFNKIVTH